MTETGTQVQAGADEPPPRRLRYFHGQMLGARDFQREQDYHRGKARLRLRRLLGYGVVCGLLVEPVREHGCPPGGDARGPEDDRAAADGAAAGRRGPRVRVTPGLAVDSDGNEITVRDAHVVDLRRALPPAERDADTVWVGVRYAERPVEPTRAVYGDACGDTDDCAYGWTEECHRIVVTGSEPPADERCDTCSTPGGPGVLWLARVEVPRGHEPPRADRIHMDVRRPFGRHVPTVITGVNWIHGHTYTVDEARALLGTQDQDAGLVVRFSGDVRTDSLRPGVVDLQVVEGGSGRNASTWFMGGAFTGPGDGCGEFTRWFRYRQTTRETLQDGDRVLITVRAAFLLDRCRRPVDGTHVGGRVPLIADPRDPRDPAGAGAADAGAPGGGAAGGPDLPPSGVGPWTSGTGAGGDVFESWFFVKER
ncbi:hypothetical protein AB0A99_19235 [Streptomyces fradiae]|uniref:hypothetical protein n=1 Tax=Streptomyces fradiae TaxID=1906 RepID=UPI0033F15BF0